METGILSRRDGFTMVEVLVAMVILGIAILGVQAAVTDHFVRDVGTMDRSAVATQLVEDRIQSVQLDPVYATLEDRYELAEPALAGYPGFSRDTRISHVRSAGVRGVVDYKKVTVEVRSTALPRAVSRTVTVAAP
jgi:prepilin-type N-terminal cleavage/methylation domain-containing protein